MSSRKRYKSRTFGGARYVAQRLTLKPAIGVSTKVQVHGKENLTHLEAPFIVVANHSSHLDAPLITQALPNRLSRYLATGVAADYFFDKWYKAAPTSLFFNAYPIERGGAAKKHRGLSGQLLADGVPILVFPEGTRSRDGAPGTFKPGAAALSISHNAPILPVALVGAWEAMPSGNSLPRRGRPTVHVVFGLPMSAKTGENARAFTERIRQAITEQHDTVAKAVGKPTLSEYTMHRAIRSSGGVLTPSFGDDLTGEVLDRDLPVPTKEPRRAKDAEDRPRTKAEERFAEFEQASREAAERLSVRMTGISDQIKQAAQRSSAEAKEQFDRRVQQAKDNAATKRKKRRGASADQSSTADKEQQ
ncbi:lysophospholipid acyltransferase family protein [Parenemella sanctibonifatiensis]|uniref:1-acyl-sn-glycerol-3-phosphate acyltransferase n=1 Tax=Parenemella sanctibonifatiensis TaxID=2016505 RepID=A0A255EFP4_9ACTN|nr:1-acyl-sn-glycerol-3-phosphate acyltransferase [Parenemella sanctibonifatiensis]OYN90357.1 1-acyl-sn-glycerol-3-phosphate acyltransferase [Parenemella sanctibonifatiensis]